MFSDPFYNVDQLNLQSGMKVADFGSGVGFYSMALAKAVGDKGRIYAVDVQKDALNKLKKDAVSKGFLNVEVVWGDLERMGGSKLKDGSIDAVVVTNILFQIKHRDVFIEEIKRVLKTKGRVLIIDWHDSFGGLGPNIEHIISRPEAKKLFEEKGFSFERDIRAGDHHWGVIMKKG